MKRSVTIAGHRTSISLEEEFWEALREIAGEDGRSINALVGAIDERRTTNLSSAIRLFVLSRYRDGSAARGPGISSRPGSLSGRSTASGEPARQTRDPP